MSLSTSSELVTIDFNDSNTIKLINIVNNVIAASSGQSPGSAGRDGLLSSVMAAIEESNYAEDVKQALRSSELLSQLVDGFLNGSVQGQNVADAVADVATDAVAAAVPMDEKKKALFLRILKKLVTALVSCLSRKAIAQSAVPLSAPRPSPVQTVETVHQTSDEPPALELSPDAV